MPALSRKWWYFRLAVFAFAATGLGFYLFHATPWRKALGIQPDYREQMAEGDKLVAAIYAYHYDIGLWPQYLDDLKVPAQKYRWFYEVRPLLDGHRRPALSTDAPAEGGRTHLAFDFGPFREHGDWHVFSSNKDRIERAGSHLSTGSAPLTRSYRHEPLFAVTLAELDRRIARERGIIDHYQDKAALLALTDHLPDARQAIADARAQFPDAAWPRLAVAALDLDQAGPGQDPPTVSAFAAFADAKPTFSRYFGLSWLYRKEGETTQARIAMAKTIHLPVEVDADDRYLAAFYLYDMTRWALEMELWNLAFDICNAWEKAADAGKVRDRSYLALRAASDIGRAQFASAQADLAKFRALKPDDEPAWIAAAADSIKALEDAAAKSNSAARLAFPPSPGKYQAFVLPE